MKYEYLTLKFTFENLGDLNQLGQAGWAVVWVQQDLLDTKHTALLMRDIPE